MLNIPSQINPSAEVQVNDFLATDDAPWQMKIALHNGDSETVELLKSSPKYSPIQKELLDYIVLSWEESPLAKKQLLKFVRLLTKKAISRNECFIYKAWANLYISELYLLEGSKKRSQSYLNYAISFTDNSLPHLRELLALYNIYLKILGFNNSPEDSLEIDQIIKLTTKRFLLGYAWYLKGKILKNQLTTKANETSQEVNQFDETSENNEITEISKANETEKAIDCFNMALSKFSPKDLYAQGLVNLELAELENTPRAAELLAIAQDNFTQVRKTTLALEAKNRLIQLKQQQQQEQSQKEQKPKYAKLGNCVFISPPMRAIYEKITNVIANRHDFPVLILGERGTGKDMIAQAIHVATAKGKMVAINCAAIEDSLLQAELFGYKKGAFTGADKDKQGLVEQAHEGTLFLDEIADLSSACQGKLLRLLEKGDFRRLGDNQDRVFKGRVVAATNKDLESLIAEGKFREDLYDRLNGWVLYLPPLRQRKEELLPLAQYFLHLHGQEQNYVLTKSAQKQLLSLDHNANVRGLQRMIERAIQIAMSQNTNIVKDSFLVDAGRPTTERSINDIEPFYIYIDKCEKEYVVDILQVCEGNRSLALDISELSRSSFFRMLHKHGVKKIEGE